MKLFWDILQSMRNFSEGERMAVAGVIMLVASVLVMNLLSHRLSSQASIIHAPDAAEVAAAAPEQPRAETYGPAAGLAESFKTAASFIPRDTTSVKPFYETARAYAETAYAQGFDALTTVLGSAGDVASRYASQVFDKGADYVYETFIK